MTDRTRIEEAAMTNSEYFNRDQLLEHALLDAHGLLDEVDTARFSRGFQQATPQLQAEIVRIQEIAATIPEFQTSESPVPSLRLRTIARVMHAAEEAARPATIARIGRDEKRDVTREMSNASGHTVSEELGALRGEIAQRTRAPFAQSFWRAAALFFAAGLAVTLWFNARSIESIRVLAEAVNSNRFNQEIAHLAELAPGFEGHDFNGSTPYLLSATAAGGKASGVLYLDASSGTIAIVAFGLKEGATLVLRTKDESGAVHNIGTCVASKGACAGYFASIPAADFGKVFELAAANGDVVLRVRSNV